MAKEINQITGEIIGAAIEVHRVLGPGLLESVYQSCMERELLSRGFAFAAQVPVTYKDQKDAVGAGGSPRL